jgi:hypothetical protein
VMALQSGREEVLSVRALFTEIGKGASYVSEDVIHQVPSTRCCQCNSMSYVLSSLQEYCLSNVSETIGSISYKKNCTLKDGFANLISIYCAINIVELLNGIELD